jgi:hypothetical protein
MTAKKSKVKAKRKDDSSDVHYTLESDLSLMSVDMFGGVNLTISGRENNNISLHLSRLFLQMPLPKDFDPSRHKIAGKLSITMTVSEV